MKNGILNILYTLRNIAFMGKKMYVPNLDIYSTIPYREICSYASQAANVPYATVDLVMKELYACFEYYLCNGHSFKFSGLGTYALALKTKSDLAINPDAREGADAITNSGIRFTPDKELLDMLSNLSLSVKAVGDGSEEETEPIFSKIVVGGFTAMELGKPTAKRIPLNGFGETEVEIYGYNLNALGAKLDVFAYSLLPGFTPVAYDLPVEVNSDGTHARAKVLFEQESEGPRYYILDYFRFNNGSSYVHFNPNLDITTTIFWDGQWSLLRGEKFVNIMPGQAIPSGQQTVKFTGITNHNNMSILWGNGQVTPRELSKQKGVYEVVYDVDNPTGEFEVSLGAPSEYDIEFIGVSSVIPMVSSASANMIVALNGETAGVMPNRNYSIVLVGQNLSPRTSVTLPAGWQFVSLSGTSTRLILKVVTGTNGGDITIGSNFKIVAAITDAPFRLSKFSAVDSFPSTTDISDMVYYGPVGAGGKMFISTWYRDIAELIFEDLGNYHYCFVAQGSGIGNCTNVSVTNLDGIATAPQIKTSKLDDNTLAIAFYGSALETGVENGSLRLNFKANASSVIDFVNLDFAPYGNYSEVDPGGGNGGGE